MSDDPDLQEAHSRRYGNDCILFLRLESGRFALLNARHDLHSIVDTVDEVLVQGEAAYKIKTPAKRKTQEEIEIDLSDLDFTTL
jgi:hypothetical protein